MAMGKQDERWGAGRSGQRGVERERHRSMFDRGVQSRNWWRLHTWNPANPLPAAQFSTILAPLARS